VNGGKVQKAILAELGKREAEPTTLELLTLSLSRYGVVSSSRAGYESVRRAVAQLVERGLLKRQDFLMSSPDGRSGRLVLVGLASVEDALFLEAAPLIAGFTDLMMNRVREKPPFSTNSSQEKRWATRTTNQEEE
jgi:hypothetical protein